MVEMIHVVMTGINLHSELTQFIMLPTVHTVFPLAPGSLTEVTTFLRECWIL